MLTLYNGISWFNFIKFKFWIQVEFNTMCKELGQDPGFSLPSPLNIV